MWRGWLRKIWHFLSQLRLGVILLGLLLGAVFLGTLLPQLPRQAETSAWWTFVRERYGALYSPLRSLGLFDLYGSLWFQGLLALLLLSTLACFCRRVWPLSRVVFRPRTRLPRERFERGPLRTEISFASDEVAESALRTALRRRHYRVQVEKRARSNRSQQYLFLRADRYRLPRLGTLLTHIGLIFLLSSVALGSLRRWRAPDLAVKSDQVVGVAHGTGIGLRCDQFTILRYGDGSPRDFRAEVTLIAENGEELRQGTVRLNRPLSHAGVSYYLQGYHLPSPSSIDTRKCDVTLSAVYDPGYPLIVVAGLCLVFGMTLTFHFPHRRLWARSRATGETTLVGSTAWDRDRFASQFEALAAELREVTPPPTTGNASERRV